MATSSWVMRPPPEWLEDDPVVIGYKIVKGLPDEVEREVNMLLTNGWEIHGVLCTYTSLITQQTLFAQAMIKVFREKEVGGMTV